MTVAATGEAWVMNVWSEEGRLSPSPIWMSGGPAPRKKRIEIWRSDLLILVHSDGSRVYSEGGGLPKIYNRFCANPMGDPGGKWGFSPLPVPSSDGLTTGRWRERILSLLPYSHLSSQIGDDWCRLLMKYAPKSSRFASRTFLVVLRFIS